MVGENGGSMEIRRYFLSLSSNTFTSLDVWLNRPLYEVQLWVRAFVEKEGAEQ